MLLRLRRRGAQERSRERAGDDDEDRADEEGDVVAAVERRERVLAGGLEAVGAGGGEAREDVNAAIKSVAKATKEIAHAWVRLGPDGGVARVSAFA